MEGFAIALGLNPTGLTESRQLSEAIYRKLTAYPRFLLIFDNAESLETLEPYLPRTRSPFQHILLTSRSQRCPSKALPKQKSKPTSEDDWKLQVTLRP